MNSILNLIIKAKTEFLPWVDTTQYYHNKNHDRSNIPAKLLLDMEPYISVIFNADYFYWRFVAACSDPMLTAFIRKNHNNTVPYMTNNTNPALADLIISYCSQTHDSCFSNPNIGLTDYILNSPESDINYEDLSMNENPKLTKFIIASYKKLNKELLCTNKNPELVELMMIEPHWETISSNPNIGLTDIIINNPDKINYEMLSHNTNKKLIPFMYENRHKLNHGALVHTRAMMRRKTYNL